MWSSFKGLLSCSRHYFASPVGFKRLAIDFPSNHCILCSRSPSRSASVFQESHYPRSLSTVSPSSEKRSWKRLVFVRRSSNCIFQWSWFCLTSVVSSILICASHIIFICSIVVWVSVVIEKKAMHFSSQLLQLCEIFSHWVSELFRCAIRQWVSHPSSEWVNVVIQSIQPTPAPPVKLHQLVR